MGSAEILKITLKNFSKISQGMDTSLRTNGTYVFSGFRLDAARRSLTRDGKPVSLSSRVFDTLLYFVENPDRLIEKDELLNVVWGGRYVEEANLSQTVFVLRKALKDAGEEKNLISTVSGHGYCFIAAVQPDAGRAAPAANANPPRSTSSTSATQGAAPHGGLASRSVREALHVPGRIGYAAFSAATILLSVAALFLVVYRSALPEHRPGTFHPPPRSVAVLAFANMSGDPNQEYLADGFSEELINSLTRVDALRVADRTSAFYFKNRPATVADIARELNVGAVLEGSVRRERQHLRITAELTNAITGYQFWSRSYDRDFGDILNLQREIAQDVTRSLQVTLQAGDTRRLTLGGTNNSAAFDAYLQGVRLIDRLDETSYRAALAAFDEAARLDPRYAGAQVMRAHALIFIANFDTSRQLEDTLAQARQAASLAVALAPGWGQAYAARGHVLLTSLDFAGAERELLRARNLAPADVGVDRTYAFLEACLGHAPAAETAAARVVARYSAEAYGYAEQAQILYLDRRYQDSLAALHHAGALAETKPPRDQAVYGLDYLALGKPEAAYGSCISNRSWQEMQCLAIAARQLGRPREAEAHLVELRKSMGDSGAYQYAETYAQWGDRDNALMWLRNADRLRDTGLVMLKTDPLLDPIRGAPEFADIERRLDFPP